MRNAANYQTARDAYMAGKYDPASEFDECWDYDRYPYLDPSDEPERCSGCGGEWAPVDGKCAICDHSPMVAKVSNEAGTVVEWRTASEWLTVIADQCGCVESARDVVAHILCGHEFEIDDEFYFSPIECAPHVGCVQLFADDLPF